MNRYYLGDSYDIVKRLWRELLADWASLYAEERFVPVELRDHFTRLTGVPILPNEVPDEFPGTYSILNDPDTGVRLPGRDDQSEGRTHISIPSIARPVAPTGRPLRRDI